MTEESLGTYLHLTRKELQKLCKFHKLPANKSHAELANSLASFFKEKNYRSGIGLHRASQGTCSEIVNLDEERENAEIRHENKTQGNNLVDSSQKEIDTNVTLNRIIDNIHSSTSEPNSKDQTLKSQSLIKTLDPKVRPEKPVSFEYSVYSEEGINFYIDLNPNPSEWSDNLNKENLVNPINSLSPALSENIQTETTQNPNSQYESPVTNLSEEKGEENQDTNKNTINNGTYDNITNNISNDENEIIEVPMKNGDSEGRAHLLVSCQNDEKLKREKVMREKIDPSIEEQSVIVLDSSGDEGDVTQAKAKDSSELLDANQALDKNSKRPYNQDTEELLSHNKRHHVSDESNKSVKNVNMKVQGLQ